MLRIGEKARRQSGAPARKGWRDVVMFALLAVFTLQTYVFQTHIHAAGDHAVKADSRDHHDRFPPGDDPASCPLCQEFLHSGQFITPQALVLLPPMLAVSTLQHVDAALPHVEAPSHDWRGRAPPKA
jgi:hypothetical protein